MKSLFYTIALVVFSAIILKQLNPKPYPPPAILEQRRDIVQKEREIEVLINKIDYNIKLDSISIATIKQNE